MQVDWISGFVAARDPVGYDSGTVMHLGPDGEMRSWRKAPMDVEQEDESSSRNFRVWTPDAHRLYLSGNPVKLLQGHNLWGSCDPIGLYLAAGQWIREQVGLFPGPRTWDSCGFSFDHFSRLDITRSYRFQSGAEASSFILHVAGASRSRHGSAKLYGSDTAHWGQGSRRWSLKAYNKLAELLHLLKKRRQHVPAQLLAWAEGVVRFEVTLRGLELEPLKLHEFRGGEAEWRQKLLDVWSGYYSRVTWSGGDMVKSATEQLTVAALGSGQRMALEAWLAGQDVRPKLPRRTFYRYRRAILEAAGVDIGSAPPERVKASGAAPLALSAPGWDPEPLEAAAEPRGVRESYQLI